jgi:hypothetical protein
VGNVREEERQKAIEKDLSDARSAISELANMLPKKISAEELGVWLKIPYKALSINSALGYRVVELAGDSVEACDKGRWASAATLARSTLESCALGWDLLKALQGRTARAPKDLSEKIDQLLLGSKQIYPEGPRAINVLSTIDRMAKTFQGVDRTYAHLCEVAHPNWSGVQALFATIKYDEFETEFGPRPTGPIGHATSIALASSVNIFKATFGWVEKEVAEWLPSLSPLSGARPPDPGF